MVLTIYLLCDYDCASTSVLIIIGALVGSFFFANCFNGDSVFYWKVGLKRT